MDEKRKAFLRLMHQAHVDAKRARKYSFDHEEDGQREDKVVALSYASACVARISAAQALYYACLDELEHQEIPELFGQFQVFTSEVFDDYATEHSRQWVDIEYNRLDLRASSTSAAISLISPFGSYFILFTSLIVSAIIINRVALFVNTFLLPARFFIDNAVFLCYSESEKRGDSFE